MNFHNLPSLSNSPLNGSSRLGLLWLLMTVLATVIALPTLTGCDSSSRDSTVPELQAAAAIPALPSITADPDVTPPATSTPIATSVPVTSTVLIATHAAYATNVVVHRQEIRTSVAVTNAPTITPGRPQSRPSPTPMMGMLPGCGNASSYGPQAYNCWRGVVDGDMVEVYAGREGSNGDPTQGIVRVHIRGQQGDDNVYQTPDRVGAVQIASVDGTQFTLETVDEPTPQVFVFDLEAREWVSP